MYTPNHTARLSPTPLQLFFLLALLPVWVGFEPTLRALAIQTTAWLEHPWWVLGYIALVTMVFGTLYTTWIHLRQWHTLQPQWYKLAVLVFLVTNLCSGYWLAYGPSFSHIATM